MISTSTTGSSQRVAAAGVSEPTFYKSRSKYGGLEASQAKRPRTLERESARLKKLLAESMMDVSTLREMLGKNF